MDTHQDLDDLEYRALEMALDGSHPALEILRAQLAGLRVAGRDEIPGGFVARLEVTDEVEAVSAPRFFHLLDVYGTLKGIRNEVGFIVFVEDGRLARLEGQVSGSDAWPGAPELRELYYKHPIEPGRSELVRTSERDRAWALGPEAGFSDRDLDETEPQPLHDPVSPPPSSSQEEPMSPDPAHADETQQVPPDELPVDIPPADESGERDPFRGELPSPAAAAPPFLLPTRRLMYLLATNVFLATLLCFLASSLLSRAAYLSPAAAGPALDAASPEIRQMLISALLTVLVTGALGAVLSNLRGLFQHNRDHSGFPTRFEIPFYLRPVTGALTGFVLFLAINFVIAALTAGAASAGWATMPGRMVYAGIALLAGFTAQEGLERWREVARALLGIR